MEQTVERAGEAFEFAEQLTVVGRKPQVGDLAPGFLLGRSDAAAGAMRQVRPTDSGGTVRRLDVVNSLDTPVCQVNTRGMVPSAARCICGRPKRWHRLCGICAGFDERAE